MLDTWINFIYDGNFKRDPHMKYVGGTSKKFEFDVDYLCNQDWDDMVGSLTDKEISMLWAEDPLQFGDDKYVLIDRGSDNSIHWLIDLMRRFGGLQIFVEHPENMGEGAEMGERENVVNEAETIDAIVDCDVAVNGTAAANDGQGSESVDNVTAEVGRVVYDDDNEQDGLESSSEEEEEENVVDLDSGIKDDSKLIRQVFGNWDENTEDDIENFESLYLSDDDEELNEIREKIKVFNMKWADLKVKVSIVVGGANLWRQSKLVRQPNCERNAPAGFIKYDPKCKQVEFFVTQIFDSPEQFKDAIDKYSIVEQRPVRVHKNCTEWVRARCQSGGCPWFISLGFDKKTRAYHVKTLVNEHTCGISFKNRRADSSWLADYFLVEIRNMPNITLHGLQNIVKEKLGVDISTSTCRRTKLRVFQKVLGSYKEEYGLLCEYAVELKRRNPGTTCEVRLDPPPKGSINPVFNAFYVCFDALKKGFKAGCRQIFGVDGCWLKGVCKGQLLSAIGRDGNDQMFPIAWAVVKIENTDTWTWFLEKLIEDLSIGCGLGWTIMSDKQKGLKRAISNLLPNVEHRTCARHLYANWGSIHKGPKLEKLFWSAARSTNQFEFNKVVAEIKKITPAGCAKLLETSPHQWCKAFFNPMIKCDIVHNNLCEGFNGWILDDRCKPVYSMLEGIRVKCMERLHKQTDACAKWPREYGGNIKKKLENNQRDSRSCTCVWGGRSKFEIEEGGVKYVVDLDERSCLCGGWQVTGIPCRHACCAIRFKDLEASEFLDECYSRQTVLKIFEHRIQPMPSRQFWEREENAVEPAAPPAKIAKGRRAKKRRLEPLEKIKGDRMDRSGGTVTCSNCHQTGHNKKGCKKNTSSVNEGAASQSQRHSQTVPQTQASATTVETRRHKFTVKRPCTKSSKKKGKEVGVGVHTDMKTRVATHNPGSKGERVLPSGHGKQQNSTQPILLNPGREGQSIIGMYPRASKRTITIAQLQAKESRKKRNKSQLN